MLGADLKTRRPRRGQYTAAGGVAERPKAAALKVAESRGSVGSNPTPAASGQRGRAVEVLSVVRSTLLPGKPAGNAGLRGVTTASARQVFRRHCERGSSSFMIQSWAFDEEVQK
jgi:hypothetical protein